MNRRTLSQNEKNLIKVFITLILLLSLNIFVLEPIDLKILQLTTNKENIIQRKIFEENVVNTKEQIEEDIILKVQKELGIIANIDYIDKQLTYDENGNDAIKLDIKVSGTLEQIFEIQQAINNLDLVKNIEYIEINNIENTEHKEETEEKQKIVECIMEIKVT